MSFLSRKPKYEPLVIELMTRYGDNYFTVREIRGLCEKHGISPIRIIRWLHIYGLIQPAKGEIQYIKGESISHIRNGYTKVWKFTYNYKWAVKMLLNAINTPEVEQT